MKLASIAPNAHYDVVGGKPKQIEKDNDGSFLFRINVMPEILTSHPEATDADGSEAEAKQTGWSCFEVRCWGEPTKAKVKKAIIRTLVDETTEFDLVNSYNKHILGIKEDPTAVERYKDFLTITEELDSVLVDAFKF